MMIKTMIMRFINFLPLLVGLSVRYNFLKGRVFHFNAPIGALVYLLLNIFNKIKNPPTLWVNILLSNIETIFFFTYKNNASNQTFTWIWQLSIGTFVINLTTLKHFHCAKQKSPFSFSPNFHCTRMFEKK